MVQTIRPASDISAGGWTDEGSSFNDGSLYTSVQEVSQDGDTSYILCQVGDGTCEVKLGTATDPVSAVDHVVHIWGEGVGGGAPERIDVLLYEGGTLRATVAANWAPGRGAYAEATYTLSAAEANAISDYSDLRVRMIEDTMSGGDTFKVTQIYMEVPDPAAVLEQSSYRVRTGDTVVLNANTDWAAAENNNPATTDVEAEFRIRFEVTVSVSSFTGAFKLQYNWDGGGYVDVLAPGVNPPASAVTPVSFAPSSQYNDGAATTDVLTTEAGTFVAGTGEESNNTGSVTLAVGEHTEFEFCLVIRKTFGEDDTGGDHGFTTIAETVLFRIVESDGTAFGTYTNTPTITIAHPAGLIGGTFPETTGLAGPIADPNGNLYCFMEFAQLPSPVFGNIQKSADGGDTWIPQDNDWAGGSSRELEAADIAYIPADDTLYLGWQASDQATYREYLDSTEGVNPDTFVAAQFDVTVAGNVAEQAVAIVRRSDNTTVMFYTNLSTNTRLYYKIRTAGGSWGSELDLEVEAGIDWTGVQAVIGASDLIHIIYSNKNATGEIYYRNLNSSDTLSGRTSVLTGTNTSAHHSPILKPVYWDDGGDEKIYLIYYKASDSLLYSRIVTNGTVGSESASAIIDNTVLSDRGSGGQPTAQVVVDGTDVYVVYADLTTGDIFMTKSENGGNFDTDTEIADAVTCGLMSANIFTHSAGNGGAKVIGIMYDDERFGEGNTGGVVYFEHEIAAAPSGVPFYYTVWRRQQQGSG